MRKWVTRGCLLVNILIVVASILSCYLSVPSALEDTFFPPAGFILAGLGMFVLLLSTGFYAVWTTYVDRPRPQQQNLGRKSQFVFTKDGEIIEVVEEKRKRSAE